MLWIFILICGYKLITWLKTSTGSAQGAVGLVVNPWHNTSDSSIHQFLYDDVFIAYLLIYCIVAKLSLPIAAKNKYKLSIKQLLANLANR